MSVSAGFSRPRAVLGVPNFPCAKCGRNSASFGASTRKWRNARHCSRIRAADKEDAAKKALQDMFQGKKDVLADYDNSGGDDGDGNEGGGGGGFRWWGWDDWKDNFKSWGGGFGKWLQGMLKTLGAILIFVGIMLGMTFAGPALRYLISFMRVLLRLDSPKEVFGAEKAQPAGVERSVLFDEDEEEPVTLPKETPPKE